MVDVFDGDVFDVFDFDECFFDGFGVVGVVGDDDGWQEGDEFECDVVVFEVFDFCIFGQRVFECVFEVVEVEFGVVWYDFDFSSYFFYDYGFMKLQLGYLQRLFCLWYLE